MRYVLHPGYEGHIYHFLMRYVLHRGYEGHIYRFLLSYVLHRGLLFAPLRNRLPLSGHALITSRARIVLVPQSLHLTLLLQSAANMDP